MPAKRFRVLHAALALVTASCQKDLPPPTEVLVVLDTDLPPHLASRLRVDLFSDRGQWFLSREIVRSAARDWPVSFGVTSDSLSSVVLRARAYPEGHVRDYLGERFAELGAPLPEPTSGPRLVEAGADRSPRQEPSPDVTVDRVVLLSFGRDEKRVARIVLRGACAGTMARVPAQGDDVLVEGIESCSDAQGERSPIEPAPLTLDPPAPATEVSTWAAESQAACEGDAPNAPRVCVPAGAFVFGNAGLDPETTEFTPRERVAKMGRFWMDRHEVTVAAYRSALARGFVPPVPVRANDGPLAADPVNGCSWTTDPKDREDLALTCVSWETARAYCLWAGGDLPTEARWEYAATQAGKSVRTAFPWGDEAPTCSRAAFGRAYIPPAVGVCQSVGSGPLPVGVPAGDATPLGIEGLAGGASEWMQDAPFALSDPCWTKASLADPSCLEPDARRSVRGGAWAAPPPLLEASVRASADRTTMRATLGFRCVYEGP